MQHFAIKQCSSKLQGDFSVQQFSRFCSQKVSKWQQESNQFLVKNFNQESQVRVQFTYFQWFYRGKLVNIFLYIYYLCAVKKALYLEFCMLQYYCQMQFQFSYVFLLFGDNW